MVYKSRAEKLNWDEIAFDNYSGAECRIMWETITKRIRRFRILKELIDDAKVWMMKPWTNFYRGSKNVSIYFLTTIYLPYPYWLKYNN